MDAATDDDLAAPLDGGELPADASTFADVDIDGEVLSCPTGAGTPMVRIGTAKGSFCIDTTETTHMQYAQFLQAIRAGRGSQPPQCAAAPAHAPAAPVPLDLLPVTDVNWCDAYAYCAWAGKRLCGQIGGTGNVSAWNNAQSDEWYAACSRGGTRAYPYDAAYSAKACNGFSNGPMHTVSIGSMPSCAGGYDGLFDMSGNVWEWEASCTGSTGLLDACRARGGGWYSDLDNLSCLGDSAMSRNFGRGLHRGETWPFLGIRCCAD